jgi:hypothetical protein
MAHARFERILSASGVLLLLRAELAFVRFGARPLDVVDVMVVVGYLGAKLLSRASARLDKAFDEALEGLWQRAEDELRRRGRRQDVRQFRKRPLDREVRRAVAYDLQEAMMEDPAFAASLALNVQYLDSRGGREFVAIVESDPFTSRVWWVMALAVLAAVLMLGGFGLIFYALFESANETGPSSPGFPPNAVRGFFLFFAGLCVLALSGIAHAITKG